MTEKIHLSVVTPEREVVSGEVDELTAPGWDGEFGVLPGHAPFLSLIRSGDLTYRIGEESHAIAVGFGFVEVLPHKVTVMIETAEKAAEIDLDRAMAARERAMEALSSGKDVDFEKARAALMRAIGRIKVAQKHKRISTRSVEQQFRNK
jgi:F-type H+-transporting ATPase subunit epsilon